MFLSFIINWLLSVFLILDNYFLEIFTRLYESHGSQRNLRQQLHEISCYRKRQFQIMFTLALAHANNFLSVLIFHPS